MARAAPSSPAVSQVDQTLNPLVAGLKVSKTMALTDLARSMKESGIDVRAAVVLSCGRANAGPVSKEERQQQQQAGSSSSSSVCTVHPGN